MKQPILSARNAFTIVELLIVVVVIAILAAITIIAYNGITGQAKRAGVDSSLATAKKKVELFAVENSDTYPTSLSQAGIQGSDKENQTTYRYTVNNITTPKSYCITAINGTNRSYTTNTSSKSQPGSCPGHDNDDNYITNLITNPSFENNIDGWEAFGGATIERTTEQAHAGQYSLKVVPAASGVSGVRSDWVYVDGLKESVMTARLYRSQALPAGHAARSGFENQTLNNASWSSLQAGAPIGSWISPNGMLGVGTLSGDREDLGMMIRLFFEYNANSLDASPVFYLDSMKVCTREWNGGAYVGFNKCFDGDSPSWIWNGTPHNSTSTGPIN